MNLHYSVYLLTFSNGKELEYYLVLPEDFGQWHGDTDLYEFVDNCDHVVFFETQELVDYLNKNNVRILQEFIGEIW